MLNLRSMLHDHQGIIATSSTDLGFCSDVKNDRDVGDHWSIKQYFPLPHVMWRLKLWMLHLDVQR